ncbi:transposase [Actinoplanes sp. CA-030573]|uniref:transposase n=1 Tax=Actinoplanes sp. CA-030573 TaxID=3239898 RepID=UPI003D8AC2B0
MGGIEPLLPPWPDRSPGPQPVPDRQCLQGILFVLNTVIGWEDVPQELGFGFGMTCWRRLKWWTEAGVFDHLHQLLLDQLNAANRIDWSRAAIDSSHIDAKKGYRYRSVAGQPRQARLELPSDLRRNRTPIYVLTSGANVPDISRAIDVLDGAPAIAGRPGRPPMS